jgi:hypothetical protein
VTDHASKTGYILCKPRFAISTMIKIHLALRAPNIESPQLLDSQSLSGIMMFSDRAFSA